MWIGYHRVIIRRNIQETLQSYSGHMSSQTVCLFHYVLFDAIDVGARWQMANLTGPLVRGKSLIFGCGVRTIDGAEM